MKKLLLSISLLLILLGCNGNSNSNPKVTLPTNDKISKIIEDTIGAGDLAYPHIEVIPTQALLDAEIADLEEVADSLDSRAYEDKKLIRSWAKKLKELNIDFTKRSFFIYTFLEPSMCEHTEKYQEKNGKEIDVLFIVGDDAICLDSQAIYYLGYSVSKDIDVVNLKLFANETIVVNMR